MWKAKTTHRIDRGTLQSAVNYNSNMMRLDLFAKNHNVPDWKLRFRNKRITLDQSHILHLLNSTFYGVKPTCQIRYKTPRGKRQVRVARIFATSGAESGHLFTLQKYSTSVPKDGYWSLFLKFPRGCKTPKTITNVSVKIQGFLLPKKKFQYGICDTLHADFVPCNDIDYLYNPGKAVVPYTGVSGERDSCSAFLIRPNSNLKSYCKFAVR